LKHRQMKGGFYLEGALSLAPSLPASSPMRQEPSIRSFLFTVSLRFFIPTQERSGAKNDRSGRSRYAGYRRSGNVRHQLAIHPPCKSVDVVSSDDHLNLLSSCSEYSDSDIGIICDISYDGDVEISSLGAPPCMESKLRGLLYVTSPLMHPSNMAWTTLY
jgi:hypothetical protein